ncbi:sensor histidine kinase [Azorhizobium doebereinerae]|uniref:sensor histidine kinase n=1 Tax=Azorhizobium doebereinerae TaxID=281091 RepID=UPI0004921189|nr:sensor histidine kinase [Azorhizobium doebereinerae]
MSSRQREAVEAWRRERASIFASALGHPRSLLDSVRRRLLLVILIAIMPIASACMLQGVLQLRRAAEETQQRLVQSAIAAAGSVQNVFAAAENVLQALKNANDVRNADTDCQATLAGANLSVLFSTNISLFGPTGALRCSALTPNDNVVAEREWWRAAVREKDFTLSARMLSTVTRGEILIGTLPLFGADGAFDGALAIGINGQWLDNLLKREMAPTAGIIALLDASGREVASNASTASRRMFSGRDLSTFAGELGEARDDAGTVWTFAVAPLERHGLMVAIARPKDELFRWTTVHVMISFVLPVVMVIFTLVAIWLATDRIVLQWLLYMRRVTAVYAQGHYGFRPTRMHQAPSEFRVLGHAIEDMALAVRERDARLRDNLAEKTALVREIHHRIKNSLQVVVSLLSLYGSGVAPGDDRRRFEQLRVRVNTLAVVHRIFYEASEGSQVRVHELLREMVVLLEGAADRNVAVAVEAEDFTLPTDFAVPLALMVTEIVMGMARPNAGPPVRLQLTCALEGAAFVITILASEPAEGRLDEGRADLAHGFARQLGGSIETKDGADGAVIRVAFPARKSAG